MSENTSWLWYRFRANEDDYRPVTFPPLGPYWCTGYGEDYAVIVAYLPVGAVLTDYWPEASEVDARQVEKPTFSDRFPKPDWWDEATEGAGQ